MNKTHLFTYMTDRVGPLPFCPGSGHTILLKAVDKALVKLDLDRHQVTIVTDIGCIGLTDRYFVTDAFHGLHGRSVTYACGLKLAKPEMTVITFMGDGGCGIGGTHVLNAARRNIGIKLIVANNFNYGMTGGQHSITTLSGRITATTPWSNVEKPMDLCGTVVAARGAWVYRATAFDKNLPDVIAEALEQPGFALLEVVELCTAHYVRRNKLTKAALLAKMEELGLKTGLLANNPTAEYSALYWQAYEKSNSKLRKAPKIEPSFTNSVQRQTGIIVAGRAGQRVQSAASLFAQAAMFSRLYATQKSDYPITVMTGHSVAELIISNQRIDYTGIDSPDYFVLISEEGVKRTRSKIEKLSASCRVYAEASLELPDTDAEVKRLPLLEAAKKVSRQSLALVALAALVKDSGLFPTEALKKATTTFYGKDVAEVNLKAIEAGEQLFE